MIRDDKVDLVFLTEREKIDRIIDEIIEINKTQQPVLVGTTSVESSEIISRVLKSKKKVKSNI